MKHGKKLTVEQKKLLAKWHLNPADWLAVKNTATELVVVNRYDEKTTKVVPK